MPLVLQLLLHSSYIQYTQHCKPHTSSYLAFSLSLQTGSELYSCPLYHFSVLLLRLILHYLLLLRRRSDCHCCRLHPIPIMRTRIQRNNEDEVIFDELLMSVSFWLPLFYVTNVGNTIAVGLLWQVERLIS